MFVAMPQNYLFNFGAADLSTLLYAGHEAADHIEIVATCAKRLANLRVSRQLSPEGGGGGGGGMGPPCPPPRSAPEQVKTNKRIPMIFGCSNCCWSHSVVHE